VRIPRDISGADLVKALERLGYRPTRQTGSHLRLTTTLNGEHHMTVPNHDPLRMGTLAAILASVAAHHRMTRDAVIERLLG
jgi:predicted RNA binding protein YcfA (HicA-like mRNA interferase family)